MSPPDGAAFGEALIDEARRRLFIESTPRVLKCLSQLTPDEVWRRPNDTTVSVGNLVLHLCGNLRQWIVSGLGGAEDTRTRQAEFDEPGPIPHADLVEHFVTTMDAVRETLDALDPATLLEPRHVQGGEETVVSILVHAIEHFSYHTGQITYFVKASKGVDLKYYAGKDLDATS